MRAGVFNIALEGMMLMGAFFAIAATEVSGNTWVGVGGGMLAGVVFSAVFSLAVLRFRANEIVAGIAMNLLAVGLTGFFLKTFFGESGVFRPDNMEPLAFIRIPIVADIAILGPTISGHTPLVYLGFALVAVTWVVLYRRPIGLDIRSVGERDEAARTAGIDPGRIRFLMISGSGLLCGLAGAHLSLGYASEFTENMVQGRGYTAFVAAVFGQLDPVLTLGASLLFGFADALGFRIQLEDLGLPPSVVQMFPYLTAIVVLTVSSALALRRQNRRSGLEMGT